MSEQHGNQMGDKMASDMSKTYTPTVAGWDNLIMRFFLFNIPTTIIFFGMYFVAEIELKNPAAMDPGVIWKWLITPPAVWFALGGLVLYLISPATLRPPTGLALGAIAVFLYGTILTPVDGGVSPLFIYSAAIAAGTVAAGTIIRKKMQRARYSESADGLETRMGTIGEGIGGWIFGILFGVIGCLTFYFLDAGPREDAQYARERAEAKNAQIEYQSIKP